MRKNAEAASLASLAGLVFAVLGVLGCAAEETSGVDDTGDSARDPILEGLQASGVWEVAPNKAVISDEPPSDNLFYATPDEWAAIVESAKQDPTWYAADGTRYEAMFVLPDGKAYGRKGPAPTMPEPNSVNNWGAFAGTEGPPAEAEPDGAAEGSVYTAVGNDERTRRANVYPFYALQQFPTRVNGALVPPNGTPMSGFCSGAKVGPRAVLTASHCVYNPLNGQWTSSGIFNPGQTNTTTPNGSHAWAGVYARDFVANGRQDDYAVFFVNDSSAFYYLGWLGIGWSADPAFYNGLNAKNRGYPVGPNNGLGAITVQRCADSARSDLRCDGWMYGMDIPLPSDAFWPNNLLAYHNDVSFGHSGSAIYDNNSAVLGVVTHQESQPGCNSNMSPPCPWYLPCHGPRFRQAMWDDVCSWIADPNFQSAYGQHPICHW